ncbi:hypothetical protein AKJ49_01515, partial [candidate division MSBL1 archaeon SCGC-AAA382A03]
FEKRTEVKTEEYIDMVEKKTGALIEASTKTGSLLGNGSEKEVSCLSEYGRLMGIAFQIQDDIIGIMGEKEKTGKPIGSDIQKGKWTFPIVKAYQNSNAQNKKIIKKTLSKDQESEEDTKKVIEIFKETEAIKISEKKSKDLVKEAKNNLKNISNSKAKDFLLELADFSIEREF